LRVQLVWKHFQGMLVNIGINEIQRQALHLKPYGFKCSYATTKRNRA
jgi:hypothetical protein